MAEIALGIGAVTWAFLTWVDPSQSKTLLLIDEFIMVIVVIVLGYKLLRELVQGNGFHVFVTA